MNRFLQLYQLQWTCWSFWLEEIAQFLWHQGGTKAVKSVLTLLLDLVIENIKETVHQKKVEVLTVLNLEKEEPNFFFFKSGQLFSGE